MFNWTDEDKRLRLPEMFDLFQELNQAGLKMTHYELYETFKENKIKLTVHSWRNFVKDPRIAKYIAEEFAIIAESELRKVVTDLSSSNSVGQAQILGQLAKLTPQEDVKEGPVYVYSYVAPTEEELNAVNVVLNDRDIFRKEGLKR